MVQRDWDKAAPEEVAMDAEALEHLKRKLDSEANERSYRVVAVRDGKIVVEWYRGIGRDYGQNLASAAKSVFSSILGILVHEGKLPSADAGIIDYYPEAMYVPEGEGPKEGRYVFEKDRAITFRQLISNTSGYMKPGEEPGKVYNYQTFGMNILTHAMAKLYGYYRVDDPRGSAGLAPIVNEKLRDPIGATWRYEKGNFALHAKARINIFGYYDGIVSTARDMARLGWLWRHYGKWNGRQVVPETWMRQATRTNPDILANCPYRERCYGYGFWSNDYSLLWPTLPRDAFSAQGAGNQQIFVCPSLDLVVVQSPGLNPDKDEHAADFCVPVEIAKACVPHRSAVPAGAGLLAAV
jgi:CubicO group peptidase (beta-lactamase class C family)